MTSRITCSISSFGFQHRPRNGKVAQLPEATCEQINHMLEDCLSSQQILARLQESASPPLPYPISEMNLSNWRRGGFQDWRRAQQKEKLLAEIEAGRTFPHQNTHGTGE